MTAVVAGISFSTSEPLPGLPEKGFSDAVATAVFSPSPPLDQMRLEGPMEVVAGFDPRTATVTLPAFAEVEQRSWALRQIAPVVSAMLGRPVLHGSSAEHRGKVATFVGESGMGKSTLAAHLQSDGWTFGADDLVAVRFRDQPMTPIGETLTPISGVFFLQRHDGDTVIQELTEADALDLQIHNGFGEHNEPDIWAVQFSWYHRIVEAVPHYTLVMPDDVTRLDEVAEALGAIL